MGNYYLTGTLIFCSCLIIVLAVIGLTLLKAYREKIEKVYYYLFFIILFLILFCNLAGVLNNFLSLAMDEIVISRQGLPSQIKSKETINDYKYNYLTKGGHKAFAFSIDGPYGYCVDKTTVAKAEECALHYCGARQSPGLAPCKIVSVDGRLY